MPLPEKHPMDFYKADILVTNSFNFHLSEEVFSSPFLLKGKCQLDTEFSIGGFFFSFTTLNASLPSVLACMVSEEKSDIIFMISYPYSSLGKCSPHPPSTPCVLFQDFLFDFDFSAVST